MKTSILFLSIAVASGLLFVNIYTSLIDAKSWGASLPASIATARDYFKVANPGNFFRIFSPINQLLGVLVVVLFWKYSPSTRLFLIAALVMYLFAEFLTFSYFYPRNAILFKTADLSDITTLTKAWSEWNTMNWVRSMILVVGIFCSFYSVHKIYGGIKIPQ